MIKTIKLKIALLAGVCLLVAMGGLIIYGVIAAKQAQNLANTGMHDFAVEIVAENLENTAMAEAKNIQVDIEVGLDAARTLAHTLESAKASMKSTWPART